MLLCMKQKTITPRSVDFPQWYQDVIARAQGLYDESPVTGCMTFGPLSTSLWQNIREFVDARLQHMGVENIMLPMLIPDSFFKREKAHIEGFAPEVAVVTHAGGAALPEPYCVRPTSELLFVDWFGRGGRVQSHRDLPLLVNQWCSVLRWEKRPRAFLRTAEFHWQEGHCLFATLEDCRAFTLAILDLYAQLCEDILAIPVVKGDKPAHEVFPGAIGTYTIESMMQDGKALQMGTSHMLSQNFLKQPDGKAFVSFLDADGSTQIPFYDSWAVTTRLLGALIMAHGDDDGIVLPPAIAPTQVAILPVFGANDDENESVAKAAQALAQAIAQHTSPFAHRSKNTDKAQIYRLHGRSDWFLEAQGDIAVRIDMRKDARIGDKTFHQIHSGTPLRIEIGARDLREGVCILKSRMRSREEAESVSLESAPARVAAVLVEDQKTLFTRALALRKKRTVTPASYAELKEALDTGHWAEIAWDGRGETVEKLKRDTSGGTYRCFPFDAPSDAGALTDIVSGKTSAFEKKIIVGKAY